MHRKWVLWMLMVMVFLTPVLSASALEEIECHVSDKQNENLRSWCIDWQKSPYVNEIINLREKMHEWEEGVKQEANQLRQQYQDGQLDLETFKAELEAIGITESKAVFKPVIRWQNTPFAEEALALRDQVQAGTLSKEEAHTQIIAWSKELKSQAEALKAEYEAGNLTKTELITELMDIGIESIKYPKPDRRLVCSEQALVLRNKVQAGEMTGEEARAQIKTWAEELKTQIDALRTAYKAGDLTEEAFQAELEALGVAKHRDSLRPRKTECDVLNCLNKGRLGENIKK